MTKALVVVFFRYTPRVDDHYKTQGELFLKHAKKWLPKLDAVYLADGGWGFNKSDFHENTIVYSEDYRSHCEYMNHLMDLVQEDTFLLIDPDMIIYDPDVIDQGFKYLTQYGVAGILDNSGSLDLFPANEYRDVRRRYTPYMTFGYSGDFKNRDFTWTQKDGQFEFDSMGKITFDLYKNLPYKELRDNRSSIYLEDKDGKITKSSNLDGPNFEWSLPLEKTEDLGYYHIRNSSIGLSLLAEFQVDKDAYKRRKEITPFREMMRLLMWQWQCDKQTGNLEKYKDMFLPVLEDYNISMDTWLKYEQEFEKYNDWIKEV